MSSKVAKYKKNSFSILSFILATPSACMIVGSLATQIEIGRLGRWLQENYTEATRERYSILFDDVLNLTLATEQKNYVILLIFLLLLFINASIWSRAQHVRNNEVLLSIAALFAISAVLNANFLTDSFALAASSAETGSALYIGYVSFGWWLTGEVFWFVIFSFLSLVAALALITLVSSAFAELFRSTQAESSLIIRIVRAVSKIVIFIASIMAIWWALSAAPQGMSFLDSYDYYTATFMKAFAIPIISMVFLGGYIRRNDTESDGSDEEKKRSSRVSQGIREEIVSSEPAAAKEEGKDSKSEGNIGCSFLIFQVSMWLIGIVIFLIFGFIYEITQTETFYFVLGLATLALIISISRTNPRGIFSMFILAALISAFSLIDEFIISINLA